jgi:lipid II isoglutaminyl synthase (glutamine-hydrolysing)
MNKHLNIGYFYPDLLNLYGDNGNVEILKYRAEHKGFSVNVHRIGIETDINSGQFDGLNLLFMGGGPDASQKQMYEDLFSNKRSYLEKSLYNGIAGLFICGAYQLLGHYYKSADGNVLKGLGIFDLYTEHFGADKPRCIGNTRALLSDRITPDPVFEHTAFGNEIVGFENHGGRTYLGKDVTPLAKILTGNGNNAEDATEGIAFKNAIGTYFHGPFLARNPHIADYLIHKALQLTPEDIVQLPKIDDTLILTAHTASKNLKQ